MNNKKNKIVSFIFPIYRNQETIEELYDKIIINIKKTKYDYELIFVNDGSDDDSLSNLLELKEKDDKIKIIEFSKNFGQVPAIIAGFRIAKGDVGICMSADLQDSPSHTITMIECWEKGDEIVINYRISREDNLTSKITSKFFYSFINASQKKMPKGGFDYFLLDKKVIEAFNKIDERNRFLQGDILWLGFKVKLLPYKRKKRTKGKSQWKFGKKIKYFIDGTLNISYLPIRIMTFVGIITFLIGILYSFIVAWSWLAGVTPFKGWAPIMIVLLLLGGLIMFMLGIIGEYIWRIYDETRNRPYYIIRKEY